VLKDLSLQTKFLKIISILFFARLELYIPVPGVNLASVPKDTLLTPLLSGSFLSIGSLGILPYLNASLVISLLISVFTEKQDRDRALRPKQIKIYIRYATFFWAIILSLGVTGFLIKPILFEWNFFIACKITFSLVVGSILYMWFSELITEEGLGSGSSIFIFINIAGDIPNRGLTLSLRGLAFYLLIFLILTCLQGAYKRIPLVSAKSLNSDRLPLTKFSVRAKGSIPFKLNQGGITPLVFSSSLVPFFLNLLQPIRNSLLGQGVQLETFIFLLSSCVLVFFNCTYTSLVLDFADLKEKLNSQAFIMADTLDGVVTARYFEKICYRLAVTSGVFLATLIFLSNIVTEYFHVLSFINLTTLFLLGGVLTVTNSQIKGYVVMSLYAD